MVVMEYLVYEIFNFEDEDKNKGKRIHKPTFIKYINSEKFREKLRKGKIIGTLTHYPRDPDALQLSIISKSDYPLITKTEANVLKELWIDGNSVLAELKILNTEAGQRVKSLIEDGVSVDVSMVIKGTEDSEYYYVDDLVGIDFTLDPAFDTKLVKAFSNISGLRTITFSKTFTFSNLKNFIREMTKSRRFILNKRIREVIQYVNQASEKDLNQNVDLIIRYIKDYLESEIIKLLYDPEKDIINLQTEFGLNRFVKNKSVITNADRILKRIRQRLNSTNGYLSKQDQSKLKDAYRQLLIEIFRIIASKINDKNKATLIISRIL
jgi:hypothetical protein